MPPQITASTPATHAHNFAHSSSSFPTSFWGKLQHDHNGDLCGWHPLEDHCADVAACAEALLLHTSLRRRLATLAGLHDLTDIQIARLAVLAAIHDVGKFNQGFQNKKYQSFNKTKTTTTTHIFTAGHVREMLDLLDNGSESQKEQLAQALEFDVLCSWESADHEGTLDALWRASISHHGAPAQLAGYAPNTNQLWPAASLQGVAHFGARLRQWFPLAYTALSPQDAQPHLLPHHTTFQHAFAGLVMLADWLGSDTRFFPYSTTDDLQHTDHAQNRIAFARQQARMALAQIGIHAQAIRDVCAQHPVWQELQFSHIFQFAPRTAQTLVCQLPTNPAPRLAILESETGSGKTEAALWHFFSLYRAGLVDGLYFALPTRTSALQIHQRVVRALQVMFPDASLSTTLAVPGYLQIDDVRGKLLPHFTVLWPDTEAERLRYLGWPAENTKRYLAAPVAVGTVDQVLLSTLQTNHAHLRSTALLRNLLVVDEVHASDVYMTTLLNHVLEYHLAAGGYAFLMSATLGAEKRLSFLRSAQTHPSAATSRRKFSMRATPSAGSALPAAISVDEAIQTPYPLVTTYTSHVVMYAATQVEQEPEQKHIHISLASIITDPQQIAQRALDAASTGAKVIILRNTVSDCVATQRALERLAEEQQKRHLLFTCAGKPAPHHARFVPEDRAALDAALENAFGKHAPRAHIQTDLQTDLQTDTQTGVILCATQTIQQSLDLDADFMLTDLCPMDVLLQRLGRLHRHQRAAHERPTAYQSAQCVVLIPTQHLSSYQKRGKHGFLHVYEHLLILQATLSQLEEQQRTGLPLVIPQMNRQLVENAVHSDVLTAIKDADPASWQEHWMAVQGGMVANRHAATLNTIQRQCSFADSAVGFGNTINNDRRISTRLGEGDRTVTFAEPYPQRMFLTEGSAYRHIKTMRIPAWMITNPSPSSLSSSPESSSSEIIADVLEHNAEVCRFVAFGQTYLYDRLGLRLYKETASATLIEEE